MFASIAGKVLRLSFTHVLPVIHCLVPGADRDLHDARSPDSIVNEIAQRRIISGVGRTPPVGLVIRVEAVDGPIIAPTPSANQSLLQAKRSNTSFGMEKRCRKWMELEAIPSNQIIPNNSTPSFTIQLVNTRQRWEGIRCTRSGSTVSTIGATQGVTCTRCGGQEVVETAIVANVAGEAIIVVYVLIYRIRGSTRSLSVTDLRGLV